MRTYLWWPYPSVLGYDTLNGIAPAFGVQATVPEVGPPDPANGVVFQIDDNPPAAVAAVALTNFPTPAVADTDSVYIVGHCSAGMNVLVGEFALNPVIRGQEAPLLGVRGRCTAFEMPPGNQMSPGTFLALLREYCKSFLPRDADHNRIFDFQVFYNEGAHGVVRVYSDVDILAQRTTIAGGVPTHTNSIRKHVMADQVDGITGTQKLKDDYYRTAGTLARKFCEVFRPAAGSACKVILWACYSAHQKEGQKSLAQLFREALRDHQGRDGIIVHGCTGKASVTSRVLVPGDRAVLRVKAGEQQPWEAMAIGANVQRLY